MNTRKRCVPFGYQKPDPRGNYFPMPNEIFNFGLCAGELAVYMYLMKCEDRKTFQCWSSYRTIGKATRMSKNTVKKYVDSLEEKYFIRTEHTHRWTSEGKKLNGNLLYRLRPMHAVRYHQNTKALRQAERETEQQRAEKRLAKQQKSQSRHPA